MTPGQSLVTGLASELRPASEVLRTASVYVVDDMRRKNP